MRAHTYTSAEDFQRRAPADAVEEVKRFGAFGTTEVAERFQRYATSFTPIGGIMSKRRRNRTPGNLQRNWRLAAAVVAGGRGWALANRAAYAGIIDRGRRRGITPVGARKRVYQPKRGRKLRPNPKAKMLGSVLAPFGITKPTWRRLKRDEAEVTRIAVQAAEAGGRG